MYQFSVPDPARPPGRTRSLDTMEDNEPWDGIFPSCELRSYGPTETLFTDTPSMDTHLSPGNDNNQLIPNGTGFSTLQVWPTSSTASQYHLQDYADGGAGLSYIDSATHSYNPPNTEVAGIGSDFVLKRKLTNDALEEEAKKRPSHNNGNRFYCDKPSCNGSFARKADKTRHHKTVHDGSPIFCGCCDNKNITYFSARKDKFKEHQQKVHGRCIPFYPCPFPSCLGKNSLTKHAVLFGLRENLKYHLHQKHGEFTSDPQQSNLCSANPERPHINESSGDQLIYCSTTSPATSLSQYELQHGSNTNWSVSLSSLSDIDTHHFDRTAPVETIRFEYDVSGSEQNVVDTPEHSVCREIGSASTVTPSLACDPDTTRVIQATETGDRLSQQELAMDTSEDADTGPQLADTKQQEQSTTTKIFSIHGLPVYASLIPDMTIRITDLPDVSIPNVGPAEYFALSRLGALCTFENALKSSLANIGKLEISFITFSISARSINLRGPSDVVLKMKKQLEMILNGIRKGPLEANPSTRTKQPLTPPKCLHHAPSATHSNRNSKVSEKIFSIRKEEDSAVLITWLKQILPSLPEIMARSIGDTYSASLVRQGQSSSSAQAVIRIQSPIKPSKAAQSYVRRQVIGLYDRSLVAGSIRLHFCEGCLTPLAGSSSPSNLEGNLDHDDTDEEDNSCKFPHWKRFWPSPGMSASIGMRCTRKVSATSCCYVDIDGEKFLLTVKHFIKDSRSKSDSSVEDKLSLTSPALLEKDEMVKYFDQFLLAVYIEIEEALRKQYGDTLPSTLEVSDELLELEKKKEYVQGLLEDLTGKDEKYLILGSVVDQNKSDSRVPTGKAASLWSELGHDAIEIRHHMDWAIWSVSKRAGENRIRYKFDPDNGSVDFFSGDTEKSGGGVFCQTTFNVEPNAKVYYVGQTSGRQTAEINAAPKQVSRDGIMTLEWTLTVPEEEQKEDKEYAGDSGAGIMRISDNSLVGLLWGCQDKQLLFAPINDVFADIKEQTKAANVRLSPIRTNPAPSPIPIRLPAAREPTLICRGLTQESPNYRRAKASDLQLPVSPKKALPKKPANVIPTLDSSLVDSELSSPPRLEAIVDPVKTFKARLLSPVPSLTSSPSPRSESASLLDHCSSDLMQQEVIPIGPKPQTGLSKSVAVIREDSEISGLLVTEEMSPPKFRLQELTERFLGAVADKENRMSFKNILTEKHHKAMKIKAPSFRPLERLTGECRSCTWPESRSNKLGLRQVKPEMLF